MEHDDGPAGAGAGAGRITVDATGTVLDVDHVASARLGRPAEELVGLAVLDVVGSDTDGMAVVAAVGHELRSPLTSIRGYTSLLLNRWDRIGDEDKQLMLGQISHDAERVTRLINELLDISRLETGHLSLAPQEVALAELAASVVTSVQAGIPELDATLVFADDLPVVVADADKIEQVLTNLVENGAKYGSPVGLVIEGTVREADGCVAVTVRDQGPGIPDGDLPHVFDRWFQREQGRPSGTGLGLWISRGLVEAHGGTLTVASPPGDGAAFTFTLPLG